MKYAKLGMGVFLFAGGLGFTLSAMAQTYTPSGNWLQPNTVVGTETQTQYPVLRVGQDMTKVLGSPFSGNNTIQVGGSPMTKLSQSPMGAQAGYPQNLVINGNPDGPFNNGCSLCVFTRAGAQNTTIAELGGDDFENGGGLVPAGFDIANYYGEVGNQLPRLILPVTSYTATTAVLTGTLTADQLLMIHPSQYIVTNSIDATSTGTESWSAPSFLAGIVKSVDNSGPNAVITVWAWNRLGQSGTSKVPSTTEFDTLYFPHASQPQVYVGSPTKTFGANTLMAYDGETAGAGQSETSTVHQMEWTEVDFNIEHETRPGSVSYHGLTFGGSQTVPSGATITPSQVFTQESYEVLLANDMPHHLIINDACGNMSIETPAFYLPSKCNIFTAPLDSANNHTRDIAEFHADSINTTTEAVYQWRIALWLGSDASAYDYTQDVLHFGPRINGTPGIVGAADQASVLGDIQFSGKTGGIALCGYGTNCGIVMNGDGSVNITQGTNVSAQLSALSNFVLRGNQYIQTTSGQNQATLYGFTDASGNNQVRLDGLVQGVSLNLNLATDVNNDLSVTGSTKISGNFETNVSGGNSVIHGNLNVGGGVATASVATNAPVTYATLPSSPAVSQTQYCTDCYSVLRSGTYTKTGVWVTWNGSDWTDPVGNVIAH